MYCITALKDDFKKTIMEYIDIKERVFPIGRLDFNTSGLLILTNDGDFANLIMHPRYEIKKTYYVVLTEGFYEEDAGLIENGIMLDDGKSAPAKVNIVRRNEIEITIHEGKNRIIRRIMKKLGYEIKSLQRIRIGSLDLGNLKSGCYRNLTENDKKKIFDRNLH